MEEYRKSDEDSKVEAKDTFRKLRFMMMKLELIPFSFDTLMHEYIQDTMRYLATEIMITGGITYGPAGEFQGLKTQTEKEKKRP